MNGQVLIKSCVQWWTRNKHLQMLAKPFSVMNSKDWDSAPRNTNGVELANALAKSGGNKPSPYAAMQSLYEKDKMFALQYIASKMGPRLHREVHWMKNNVHKLLSKRSTRRSIQTKMLVLGHQLSVSILQIMMMMTLISHLPYFCIHTYLLLYIYHLSSLS